MTDASDSALPPSFAGTIARRHPELWAAYAAFGGACAQAGPLAGDVQRLVKLALAIGAASEGAVHSHVRRAVEAGVSADAIRHVAILAAPTLGFPRAAAALTWIDDVLVEGQRSAP